MVNEYRLRAGTVSAAPPDGRDAARGPRFLLERHLHERLGAREGDCRTTPRRRMLRRVHSLLGRIVSGSARSDWTLLAVSYLLSGAIVMAMRSVFGAGG